MSKTIWTSDDGFGLEAVMDWCVANNLRAGWIPVNDVLIEGDTIRYREIVPYDETEAQSQTPRGILAPTDEDEFAEELTGWMTKPLLVHPSLFGLPIVDVVRP